MKKNLNRLIYASSKCADMLYASGFHSSDEYIYVECDGKGYVVLGDRDIALAREQVKQGVTVVPFSEISKCASPADLVSGDFFEKMSLYFETDRWLVPENFPLGLADKLRSFGIPVIAKQGRFYPGRMVKSPAEIEEIRKSECVTQEMMMMVYDVLKQATVNSKNVLERANGEVLTSEYLRCEVDAEFKRRQYSSEETIVACGCHASQPHCVGYGPIYAHQPIVCDIFPQSDVSGYWGDMTRTFCKGEATPVVKKAFKAVRDASDAVLKALKAGTFGHDMHNLAERVMEQAGFETTHLEDGTPIGFIHGLGHGVGLDIHETPRLAPSYPHEVPANSIVTVEPGLYNPEWGGIRLEDLVLVKEDGIENFCTMEKELEIL